MNELNSVLKQLAEDLVAELAAGFNPDGSVKNKSAIKRARKITLSLTKTGKEFRTESVKAEKGA